MLDPSSRGIAEEATGLQEQDPEERTMSMQIRRMTTVLPVLCAAAAFAAPPGDNRTGALRAPFVAGSATDGPGWSDNFDGYAANSALGGQGGWAPWCQGG